MGELAKKSLEFTYSLIGRAAAEQGGVLSGDNPSHYNAANPIRLWIIQVAVIIAMSQILSLILGRIRQPRVIAEVISGVILGPSVMGHIPHFRQRIFPEDGMAMLSLTSTIGLVLFLFLVGMEIDVKVIRRNFRASAAVSIAGLIIPLGLGAALGIGVYREFVTTNVNFGYFVLFVAVAIGITAFPVLCRILTELKLLDTSVGVVTLSAGVGNDVVGWILLALAVALVNASNGLTALYVLLCCLGYVILLLYPGRWTYAWLARRTGSLEQGSPTPFMMTITMFLVFGSAFFTDIIGVHAIFGGFLAGLIIPHDNGYAISLVEKMEDLVSILFLPIYFVLSGLRTDLGLLDNGITWGYIILICVVAFSSKFFACASAAKLFGFNWRESAAIGSLMSCKGLVELIVLNIGLQAKILDPRTFSMFVVHALVLTFMTTPLVLLFYPEHKRVHEHGAARIVGGIGSESTQVLYPPDAYDFRRRFSVVLERFEHLPIAMMLTQLLQAAPTHSSSLIAPMHSSEVSLKADTKSVSLQTNTAISVSALRLIELSNRTSAVLKSQESDTLLWNDPIISVFKTFGQLNRLIISAALSVVVHEQFHTAISEHAAETESQMVILPWCNTTTNPPMAEGEVPSSASPIASGTGFAQTSSTVYSEFVRRVFSTSRTDVALFVDRGSHPASSKRSTEQHLFLPFFGGPDDRLALSFLVQLCANPNVHATVIKIEKVDGLTSVSSLDDIKSQVLRHTTIAVDTIYAAHDTQNQLQSRTSDSLLWERLTGSSASHPPHIAAALSRIHFDVHSTNQPLHTVSQLIGKTRETSPSDNMIVVLGRSRRLAPESHQAELLQLLTERSQLIGSALPIVLGEVGAALVATDVSADLLIVQSK